MVGSVHKFIIHGGDSPIGQNPESGRRESCSLLLPSGSTGPSLSRDSLSTTTVLSNNDHACLEDRFGPLCVFDVRGTGGQSEQVLVVSLNEKKEVSQVVRDRGNNYVRRSQGRTEGWEGLVSEGLDKKVLPLIELIRDLFTVPQTPSPVESSRRGVYRLFRSVRDSGVACSHSTSSTVVLSGSGKLQSESKGPRVKERSDKTVWCSWSESSRGEWQTLPPSASFRRSPSLR